MKNDEIHAEIVTPLNVDNLLWTLARILADEDGCDVVEVNRIK